MARAARSRLSYQGFACPHCAQTLRLQPPSATQVRCPHCQAGFEAAYFQPPQRTVRVLKVAEAGPGAGAVCAKHAKNTAVANCERCGDFMCSLCRIEADAMQLCPPCFERLSTEGALPSTVKSFRNYRGLASTSAAAGVCFWFFGIVIGPAALYYGYKGFQQRKELGESGGAVGLASAMLFGALETVGGIFFILLLCKVFK